MAVTAIGETFAEEAAEKVQEISRHVPNRPGVYLLLVPYDVFTWNLLGEGYRPPMVSSAVGDQAIAYVGETYAIKNRLLVHLRGEESASSFRKSLRGVLEAQLGNSLNEDRITHWLDRHATAAWAHPKFIGLFEEEVLTRSTPALNLRGTPTSERKRQLTQLRRQVSKFTTA